MGWGDELMVTGHVRELQARDPRRVRIVYERHRWHESWHHNPRLAQPGEKGDFQEYRARDGYLRPYMVAKHDERWIWKAYGPPRGELYFTDEERGFGERHAGLVVIEPGLKPGASPNKDWGAVRWKAFAALAKERGLELTQLGAQDKRLLPGVRHVLTPSMRHAAAVLARARAVVVPEGGLHHVAAAVDTPAVVIFGGFIAPSVTGYEGQASLFRGEGLGCGMRVPCAHCQRAMAAIEPREVMDNLEKMLEERRRRVAAG